MKKRMFYYGILAVALLAIGLTGFAATESTTNQYTIVSEQVMPQGCNRVSQTVRITTAAAIEIDDIKFVDLLLNDSVSASSFTVNNQTVDVMHLDDGTLRLPVHTTSASSLTIDATFTFSGQAQDSTVQLAKDAKLIFSTNRRVATNDDVVVDEYQRFSLGAFTFNKMIYRGNGGSIGTNTSTTRYYMSGCPVDLSSQGYVRSGYGFIGWSHLTTGSAIQVLTMPQSDSQLYALWQPRTTNHNDDDDDDSDDASTSTTATHENKPSDDKKQTKPSPVDTSDKQTENPEVQRNENGLNFKTGLNQSIAKTLIVKPGDTLSLKQEPKHGNVTIDVKGNWVYTPAADYIGTDQFVVLVTHSDGDQNMVTVDIVIDPLDIALGTGKLPKTSEQLPLLTWLFGTLLTAVGIYLGKR